MTFARVVSRINLYDILTMLVPGGIYLIGIITFCRHSSYINVQDWDWIQTLTAPNAKTTTEIGMWFLILVASYILGMAHQTFHTLKTMICRHFKIDSRQRLLKHTIETKYKGLVEPDENGNYDYDEIRSYAQEDDTHSTIVTIEYQYAMLRSIRFPISILVALSCTCVCCAILWGLFTYFGLSLLMLARQNYLMTILMRHYRIQLKKEAKKAQQGN